MTEGIDKEARERLCSKCGQEITPSQAWCYYHHTDSTYHLKCDPLSDLKHEAAKFRQEHGQLEEHRGINNSWTTHEWTDETVAAFAQSCVEPPKPELYNVPDTPEYLAEWIWRNYVGIPLTEPYDKEFTRLRDRIGRLNQEEIERLRSERLMLLGELGKAKIRAEQAESSLADSLNQLSKQSESGKRV